mmetsp:Transcript_53630/g.142576  ORF Transcript_53630/g.142576 Transcript_53630/m.142576 type:complete len:271 (-) Transcript_53630:208-1020(-)
MAKAFITNILKEMQPISAITACAAGCSGLHRRCRQQAQPGGSAAWRRRPDKSNLNRVCFLRSGEHRQIRPHVLRAARVWRAASVAWTGTARTPRTPQSGVYRRCPRQEHGAFARWSRARHRWDCCHTLRRRAAPAGTHGPSWTPGRQSPPLVHRLHRPTHVPGGLAHPDSWGHRGGWCGPLLVRCSGQGPLPGRALGPHAGRPGARGSQPCRPPSLLNLAGGPHDASWRRDASGLGLTRQAVLQPVTGLAEQLNAVMADPSFSLVHPSAR